MNLGAKALQRASTLNAASMRDGCDDPLGKAVRAVLEAKHGTADIEDSAFESTHDWWSFCNVTLKVVEAVVAVVRGDVMEVEVEVEGEVEVEVHGVVCGMTVEVVVVHGAWRGRGEAHAAACVPGAVGACHIG